MVSSDEWLVECRDIESEVSTVGALALHGDQYQEFLGAIADSAYLSIAGPGSARLPAHPARYGPGETNRGPNAGGTTGGKRLPAERARIIAPSRELPRGRGTGAHPIRQSPAPSPSATDGAVPAHRAVSRGCGSGIGRR